MEVLDAFERSEELLVHNDGVDHNALKRRQDAIHMIKKATPEQPGRILEVLAATAGTGKMGRAGS